MQTIAIALLNNFRFEKRPICGEELLAFTLYLKRLAVSALRYYIR